MSPTSVDDRSADRPKTGQGPMHSSIVLGRVFGVAIGINWTWLIVFALISWSLADAVFPDTNPGLATETYVAMAAIGSIAFFSSVVLHELGHAAQARREGMAIDGITLWVFGGVAKFRGMFPSAGAEFRIAVAGPLVTLIIGGALVLAAALLPLPAAVDGVVVWLGEVNLVLLAFNLLPALPLDGGRVLRAALWQWKGDFAAATYAAGRLGSALGRVMIGGGIALLILFGALGGAWLALIGWFLVGAAGAETRFVAIREALEGMRVRDAMTRDPVTAPAAMTLEQFVADVFPRGRHAVYPVVDDGRVLGILPLRRVGSVKADQRGGLRVADRALPIEETLTFEADEDLAEALAQLSQTHLGRAVVMDRGRLAGVLSVTDLAALLEVRAPGAGGPQR